MVKTFVYQPMDRGSNPEQGKKYFFPPKNSKISLRICVVGVQRVKLGDNVECEWKRLPPCKKVIMNSCYTFITFECHL